MKHATLAITIAAALCEPAGAASAAGDGRGQVLLYPYYTTNSVAGGTYNTYISVLNHAADDKALRVRFREARLGKSVAELNVYLGRNDMWSAAIVPMRTGAAFVSTDRSCVALDPTLQFEAGTGVGQVAADFRNDAFVGDGAGDGLDRTREGYIEILEMATFTGADAAGMTHNAAGMPTCAIGNTPAVGPPTGGLSGTLTLIDVDAGLDFTTNAVALADVASRPYFRNAGDPYPTLAAAEVDPVSVIESDGFLYRSTWATGREAVTAALMHAGADGEYVLDAASRSSTDFVVTFPTRPLYAASGAAPPFHGALAWAPNCAAGPSEGIAVRVFNRDQAGTTLGPPINDPGRIPGLCAVANAIRVDNAAQHIQQVLGSPNLSTVMSGRFPAPAPFTSGRYSVRPASESTTMTSHPSSMRLDVRSGSVQVGAHRLQGLPMIGFTVRTFLNGTLQCGAAACQGNYGGLFPLTYVRSIMPVTP